MFVLTIAKRKLETKLIFICPNLKTFLISRSGLFLFSPPAKAQLSPDLTVGRRLIE